MQDPQSPTRRLTAPFVLFAVRVVVLKRLETMLPKAAHECDRPQKPIFPSSRTSIGHPMRTTYWIQATTASAAVNPAYLPAPWEQSRPMPKSVDVGLCRARSAHRGYIADVHGPQLADGTSPGSLTGRSARSLRVQKKQRGANHGNEGPDHRSRVDALFLY